MQSLIFGKKSTKEIGFSFSGGDSIMQLLERNIQ